MTVLKLDTTKLGLPQHRGRVEAWLRGERIAPITIDMALTQKCQMSCVFCLPPEEPVLLANGKTKPIKAITVGDQVASFDGISLTVSTVTAQWKTRDKDRLLAIETPAGTICCTPNHPILTQMGWVEASKLNIRWHYIASILHSTIAGRVAPLEEKDGALVEFACRFGKKTQISGNEQSSKAYQSRAQSNIGQDEGQQSYEKLSDYSRCVEIPVDSGASSENVETHEKIVEGRENNLCTPEIDREENEQNRIPVIGGYSSDGFYIQRQRGFLDSGMPVWYGPKPRLYLEERQEQDSASNARKILAHDAKLEFFAGNERLQGQGLERIRAVGNESHAQETSGTDKNGNKVLVGWAPIISIKDAGYSPVYDLECYPHHNFIASGVVVHNCYANLQQNPAEPVAWEIYENFLDDCVTIGHAPGEGVKAISLVSDGESTLNKYYYRFIGEAHARGIDIASGTNGEALKKEAMPMLIDNLTYLRINFNAATPAANAKIMGTTEKAFERVIDNIKELVRVKKERHGKLTIGLQMVLMPEYGDQIVPLAKFGKTLGVDYFLIKHCSDDEAGRIGVDYSWYTKPEALELLSKAEQESTDTYSVQVKWSKIKTGRQRRYSKCFGTSFLLQLSGTGVVAPCASFFHTRYKDKWIGDLRRQRWRDIWASPRYWDVIAHLRSNAFDPRHMCETLCLQDGCNEALYNLVEKNIPLPEVIDDIHGPNFV